MPADDIIIVNRANALARLPTVTFAMKMGCELYSSEYHVIGPGKKTIVSTGVKLSLPHNQYGTLAGGQHLDKHVEIHQTTILPGDDKIIKVMVENKGNEDFVIGIGGPLAYILIQPVDDLR